MEELKKSLQEKLVTWNKYLKVIELHCQDEEVFNLCNCLIQAGLFGEKGISMHELQKNTNKSQYLIKGLLKKIPDEMIVIKKKSNFKFYSMNLEKMDQLILDEAFEKANLKQ